MTLVIGIGRSYSSQLGTEPEELMINIMPIFINFLAVDSLRLDNDGLGEILLWKRRRATPGG